MVELDVPAGHKLLEALAEAGFPVDLAFWRLEDESNVWRLVLVTPEVDARGPLQTYGRIDEVLSQLDLPLDLADVSVISPNDQLAVLISGMSRPSGLKRGIRLGDSYIGPFHFGGLYIYEPLQAPAHP